MKYATQRFTMARVDKTVVALWPLWQVRMSSDIPQNSEQNRLCGRNLKRHNEP